jgi:membrane protein implicated in regulation of membrane protease activity
VLALRKMGAKAAWRKFPLSFLERPEEASTTMAAYWLWWILAGGLVAAELLSGSFYLLAVGVAFALGGVAAWLGASGEVQLAVAAVLAIAGIFVAHRWRQKHATPAPEVPFDVGQAVEVQAWNDDGTARVAYRGSTWTAQPAAPDTPRAKTMYIVRMRGSTLVIADRRP